MRVVKTIGDDIAMFSKYMTSVLVSLKRVRWTTLTLNAVGLYILLRFILGVYRWCIGGVDKLFIVGVNRWFIVGAKWLRLPCRMKGIR